MNPYRPLCRLYTLYRLAPDTDDHEIVLYAPTTTRLFDTLPAADGGVSSMPFEAMAVTT